MMRLYKYKVRLGTMGSKDKDAPEERGEKQTFSKLTLRNELAEKHPRIPMRNIIVWDAKKDVEPEYPAIGKRQSTSPHEHFSFMAREHRGQDWRVWRRGWAGDQFEILTGAEFEALKVMAQRFSIPVKIMGVEEDV